MAGGSCLEGEPCWLDVGLHCRGKGSPPGGGRVSWLFFFSFILLVKWCSRIFLSPLSPPLYNEQWEQFGGLFAF